MGFQIIIIIMQARVQISFLAEIKTTTAATSAYIMYNEHLPNFTASCTKITQLIFSRFGIVVFNIDFQKIHIRRTW